MPLPRAADGRTALQVARQCAREGGALARTAFGLAREDLGYKGRGDIVTKTDLAVERRIKDITEAAFPDHRMLSEETLSKTPLDGWVWVVDPIDGTTNFFQGIPFFCVNIALCFDGEPLIGLTYDPVRREEFLAVPGRGVRVNGKPAQVTDRSFEDATVIFDSGAAPVGRMSFDAFHQLGWVALHSRVMGSAALSLAFVAAGRADLFVFGGIAGVWDIAAGVALVREGGGVVSDHLGAPLELTSAGIVAGSAAAHAGFFQRVQDASWYRLP